MRRLIISLILLILSVWLGLRIAENPGYALFAYQHWSVEMPLWFAALAILLVFYVGYLILRIINSVDFSLYRWKNWLRWRKRYKSYSKTNQGLLEMIEGNWEYSEKFLLQGMTQTDSPLINLLAAAKAAHEQEAYDRRDTYLRQASEYAPTAEIAIGIMQAQLQIDQKQFESATATLKHLQIQAPKHRYVLKLLERVYVHTGEWEELLELLPTLRKAKLLDVDQMHHFEMKIYLELLNNVDARNVSQVNLIWNNLPKSFKHEPQLAAVYVRKLFAEPAAADDLDALIRLIIKNNWDETLVTLYGVLHTAKPTKQLSVAEGWIKQYSDQATLFLTLGRLSLNCQLWGKARSYFETSLRLQPKPETYAEYGKLLEQLGDSVGAANNYHKGLMLVVAV